MSTSARKLGLPAVIATGLLLTGVETGAQTYPVKPIRIVVGFAAGSGTDVTARLLAQKLSEEFGQQVIVENRVGAGGNIGTTAIVRSPPDGYTLGQAGQGTMVINQALYKNTGYDSVKDVAPIAMVAVMSNVMVVSEASPYKTVDDVVKAIRSKPPGTFTYSSSGIGTSMHIAGVVFGDLTKTGLTHVPYTGAPAAMQAIVAGDVDMGFFNIPAALGLIKAKRLRPLAVTSSSRSNTLPDLPTLDQAGVKGYDVGTWIGFIAPAATPTPIINKLNATFDKIFAQPEFREKLITRGYNLQPIPLGPPSAFAQLIRDDLAKWPPIIKAAGAKAD